MRNKLMVLCLSFMTLLGGYAKNYGLFVGINEYSSSYGASSLTGCIKDVQKFSGMCVELGDWTEESIVTLTNSGANKSAIRSAIANLASQAIAGDTVLIYQSSHGGQVYSNEVFLCSYDANYYDYELAADLSAFKTGVKLVVVVDSCHSGGLFKSLDTPVWNFAARVSECMKNNVVQRRKTTTTTKSVNIDPSEIGWITAADYDEYSIDSGNGGVFTQMMLNGWSSGLADDDGSGAVTFWEMFNYAEYAAVEYGTVAQSLNEDVLEKVVAGCIPEFKLIIEDNVLTGFYGVCPEDVEIPEGVIAIAASVFDADYSNSSNLVSVTIPSTVTNIGHYAFWGCQNLSEITWNTEISSVDFGYAVFCYTPYIDLQEFQLLINSDGVLAGFIGPSPSNLVIPEGVTVIGESAFDGEYYDTSAIESVDLPSTLIGIGEYAFFECENLSSVTIPSGVEYIDYGAFESCSSLTDVVFEGNPDYIHTTAFNGTPWWDEVSSNAYIWEQYNDGVIITGYESDLMPNVLDIPSSIEGLPVVAIGEGAFYDCSNLIAVYIPEGVVEIGYGAFELCTNLEYVSLPDSLEFIDSWAFSECYSLQDLYIPNGVIGIYDGAFFECLSLDYIEIPNSVEYIGSRAFAYCTYLSDVAVLGGNYIDYQAFEGCYYLQYVWLSDNVEYVGNNVFNDCSLEYMRIPQSLCDPLNYDIYFGDFIGDAYIDELEISEYATEIGDIAFAWCRNIGYVYIGDNVTSIGEFAFAGCSSLNEVYIGGSVSSIGDSAFQKCYNLEYVSFEGDSSAIEMDWVSVFDGTPYLDTIEFDPPDNDNFEDAAEITGVSDYVESSNIGATSEEFEADLGLGTKTVWWKWTAPQSCTISFDTIGSGFDTIIGVYAMVSNELYLIAYNDDFEGNQKYESLVSFDAESGMTYYIVVSGWNESSGDIVLNWGIPYNPDNIIPDLGDSATQEEIAAVLADAADPRLVANITNATEYAAFRDWALGNSGATVSGVKNSPNAWLSYALDSQLIMTAPVDGDVTIDEFTASTDDGSFEFTVNVKDITIGDGALEENIKKIFGIEGVANLGTGTFSSGAVKINAAEPVDGKVKFTIEPTGTDRPSSFFIKVKMNN